MRSQGNGREGCRAYGLVITTLLVLQTGQLNRHSPPPSSRGASTLRCIRTSQVAHFGLGIPVSAVVCMPSRPLPNVDGGATPYRRCR